MINWNNKREVIKSNIGENAVDADLIEKGWVIYHPMKGLNKGHPFDRLCAKPDKKSLLVAEVKTKARRIDYDDTGFNISQYETYCNIREKHNLLFFIYFVDHIEGVVNGIQMQGIYGNFLHVLEERHGELTKGKLITYPLRQNGIIYFPLVRMNKIADLSQEDIESLKRLTSGRRNNS